MFVWSDLYSDKLMTKMTDIRFRVETSQMLN